MKKIFLILFLPVLLFGKIVFAQNMFSGDLNNDGTTDISDLKLFISDLASQNLVADFDGNKIVDILDLNYLIGNFGVTQTPASSSAFPAQKKVDASGLVVYQVWLNYYAQNSSNRQTSVNVFDNAAAHLSDLAKMGITMIQLSAFHPFYNGPTSMTTVGSPANILDYYDVNPGYSGFTNPSVNPGTAAQHIQSLKNYIDQAHQLGIKVIADCIYHSTSPYSVLYKTHPEYFRYYQPGAPYCLPKHGNTCYLAKSGNNLSCTSQTAGPSGCYDQIELDYTNPAVVRYMIDMTKYWVNTVGIDGCRADVAQAENIQLLYSQKKQSFWAELNNEVKKIKPDWFQIAEGTSNLNWLGGPFSGPGYNPGENYSQVYSFDALYGVKYMAALRNSLNQAGPATNIQSAWTHPDYDPAHLNDLPLPGTVFYRTEDNGDQNPRAEVLTGGNSALLAGMVADLTLDGIPFIYNGQEIGDPAPTSVQKQTFISWNNPAHPENTGIISKLIALRKQYPALNSGATVWYTPDSPNVISFGRVSATDRILVVINFSAAAWSGTLTGNSSVPLSGSLTDLLSTNPVPQPVNNTLKLTLPAWSYLVARVL